MFYPDERAPSFIFITEVVVNILLEKTRFDLPVLFKSFYLNKIDNNFGTSLPK